MRRRVRVHPIGKTIVIYKKKYPYKRVVRGWVPWSGSEHAEDVLVVDCTHAKNKTITHHKGSSTPREVKVGDTSTERCITRDKDEASIYDQEREVVESYVRPFRYRRVDFRV